MDREKIENKFKWNLSSLYNNLDEWKEDYEKIADKLKRVEEKKGKLAESNSVLREVLNLELEVGRIIGNLYTYSKMKLDENMNESRFQELENKAEKKMVEISEKTAFIVPELLSMEEEKLANIIESEEFGDIKHYLENILRFKKHTLSEPEENILASIGELAVAPQKIFEMLNDGDIEFPDIVDENGEVQKLTHGSYGVYLENQNRGVRKSAFESMYSVYNKFKNTFATSLASEIKKNIFYSKVRGYSSALESSLYADNISEKTYTNLIDTVNDNLDKIHEYINLRKKELSLEEIHMYDLYVPMVSQLDVEVEYERAKELILEGLSPLGSEYTDIVKSGLESGWIDVFENDGKRSGAYSWGTYDSNPYILLNYNNTLDSVFTLAHEMGHSIHSYYTRENQPHVYGNYSIFLAEIASTVNEILLVRYMIDNAKDDVEKKYYLNHFLEQFRGTVYRQTMFAEFEKTIHERVENEEGMSADTLNGIYSDLNRKYYGNDIVIDDEVIVEWARIPHFYYEFYVFQYATGFSAAMYFAKEILEEKPNAVENYKEFLKSGSSDYPINVLKKAGLDMESSKPIQDVLDVFGEIIEEYKKIK